MTDSQPEKASIDWRDEVTPVSRRFDDPYFSIANGLHETQHVFLQGNHLPARFCPGFHIAELGFGTGLNMLAAWRLWMQSGQSGALHYTGFEAFPMAGRDLEKALSAFPELSDLAQPLLSAWHKGETRFEFEGLSAELIHGDARQTLPSWQGSANAWFLDGFAPAKNPELWGAPLMNAVFQHTRTGGTFATYTAAGAVRRTLSDAGFNVERVGGYGRKRHMTIGTKADE